MNIIIRVGTKLIPIIVITPAPTSIPTRFTIYHSGYLHRVIISTKLIIAAYSSAFSCVPIKICINNATYGNPLYIKEKYSENMINIFMNISRFFLASHIITKVKIPISINSKSM